MSKLTNELYATSFTKVYGFKSVGLRYFNVFGPKQNPNSQYSAVIPLFIKALLTGQPPVIYGDGLQSRDFTYIDNVVQANLLCLYKIK
ncbi:NAD-dependent epimerase/dehydratase family protein, partial [Salmonella enterica]|uniref:NAD-dependent epimerase/dehydratase family protein n=1 Tax=Salmonella enterica TaxID=28901 RepID=UPI003D271338